MELIKRLFNKHWLIISGITLITVMWHGYAFGIGDQVLQLPLISKLLHPGLYTNDAIFPVLYSNRTWIYEVTVFLHNSFHIPVNIQYAIFYILTMFFFYTGVYALSILYFQSKIAAYLSCLLLAVPYPVGGTAMATVEQSFIPRQVAEMLLLWMAIKIIKNKPRLAFGLYVIILFIHPLTAGLALLLFLPLFTLIYRRPGQNTPVSLFTLYFLISIIYLAVFNHTFADIPKELLAPSAWLNILKLRNFYAFPLLWPIRSWTYLGLSLIPLAIYYGKKLFRNKEWGMLEKATFTLILTATLVFIFQILFTSIIPVSWIIPLQLGRIWWLVIIISVIYAGYYLEKFVRSINISPILTTYGIVIALAILIGMRRQPILVGQSPDWIEVQLWAKTHTTPNCSFLVDFYSQGFRVYSERPIVGEYKDGTLSFYSKKFADIWNAKRELFQGHDPQWYMDNLNSIREKYEFSFVVTDGSVNFSQKPLFNNAYFSIFPISTLESGCKVLRS